MKSPGMPPRLHLLLLAATLLVGCASPDREPPRVPVAFRKYDAGSGVPKREKTLFVFLPGRGTTGIDFERQGFLQAFRQQPNVDAVTVDLTLPYYKQRIATRRLHDDVIAPAHGQGYGHIWLVGVSMGGLGAIFYDGDYPGEISGIVAIAPFLGEKNVVAEIEAAGGPDRWQPRQPLADDDFQRQLWLGIRAARYSRPGRLPLILGYGTGDRYAYGHRLLAANLPPDHVFKTIGFHDWATWHRLWNEILASPFFSLHQRRPAHLP